MWSTPAALFPPNGPDVKRKKRYFKISVSVLIPSQTNCAYLRLLVPVEK